MLILNKINRFINKRLFRTPGLEFLKKNNILKKEKHVNFWLNKAYKNKNFRSFFYSNKRTICLGTNMRFDNDNYFLNQDMLDSLKKNGIVIIKNALPEEEREKIIKFFYELKNNNCSNLWDEAPVDLSDKSFGKTIRTRGIIDINNFKFLNNYSKYATKEIYGRIVKPSLEMHYLKLDKYEEESLSRGDTYLHSDRFLPHVKIFYTPFEIKEDNSPFEYALGSHLIDDDYKKYFINAQNFDETDLESKKLISKVERVTAEKNTLYLAFTNGLHKRTAFKKRGAERFMLYLQYVERFNKMHYFLN